MNTYSRNCLHLALTAVFALTPVVLLAQDGDFIRQTQLDTEGLIRDYYVPTAEGVAPSILPLSEQGAEFSLYAQGIGSDQKLYFLDSKIVGTYLPVADVIITSEDPHIPLRTRADRPFKVELITSGMVDDLTAEPHQNSVYFRRVYENYDRETHRAPINMDSVQVEIESFYMTNGNLERTQLTSLPLGGDNDATKVEGEEVFTIFSVPDTSVPAYSVLDSEVIQIWPVAVGEIVGIVEGQRVLRTVPQIYWKAEDLYPDSTTYLQIYAGAQQDGTAGSVITSSVANIPSTTSVPQDQQKPLESWDDLCPQDGTYTLELLTITPFNGGAPEILDSVTFEVDRTIVVNAHVGGSE